MKKSELKQFFETYLNNFELNENNDQFVNDFYDQFLTGQNTIYQNHVEEIKIFDEEWIDTVESYFPSINKIISDPKSGLKYEDEVVLVEKAKKITPNSIKHLASHSENVKTIDAKGNVVPKKILTTYSDIDYATYENRVVMTLIERLFFFVRNRYNEIKKNIESFQKTKLILNAKFPVNDSKVDLNFDIAITKDLDDKGINEYNQKLLKRVENLNKLVTSFYNSSFMENLKGALKVRAPIMKTSIILKNVDYQNVYLLWLFLDRYNQLSFDLKVEQKQIELNKDYLKNIKQMALVNFATLAYNEDKNSLEYNKIEGKIHNKKGVKQVAEHPNDLLDNPKNLLIENNTANEYYLNEFKKLLEEDIKRHSENVKLEETALKRSMRDVLAISNNLYQSYFEFDVDPDIFKRLIRRGNPVNQISDLKDKLYYAKLIREVKEVDFNEHVRLERRLIKQVLDLDKILKEASKKQRIITAQNIEEEMLTEQTKKEILKHDEYLKTYFDKVKENKKTLEEEKKQALDEINLLVKELELEEDKYYQEIKDKLDKQFEKRLKALEDEHNERIKTLKERFIKDQIVQDEMLKQRIQNIKDNHEANLVLINKDLNKTYQQSYEKYKKMLDNKFLEAKITTEQITINNEFKREEIRSKVRKN